MEPDDIKILYRRLRALTPANQSNHLLWMCVDNVDDIKPAMNGIAKIAAFLGMTDGVFKADDVVMSQIGDFFQKQFNIGHCLAGDDANDAAIKRLRYFASNDQCAKMLWFTEAKVGDFINSPDMRNVWEQRDGVMHVDATLDAAADKLIADLKAGMEGIATQRIKLLPKPIQIIRR